MQKGAVDRHLVRGREKKTHTVMSKGPFSCLFESHHAPAVLVRLNQHGRYLQYDLHRENRSEHVICIAEHLRMRGARTRNQSSSLGMNEQMDAVCLVPSLLRCS